VPPSGDAMVSSSPHGIRHQSTRFLYRRYQRVRRFFSARPPDILSRVFFWSRSRLEEMMSARKLSRLDLVERKLWKAIYFQRFGTAALFRIETDRPVAVQSDDHKWPRGTAYNSSSNRNFNLKVYSLFNFRTDLRVLDLGCAGGGFVKSVLEDGYTAVGVEGSDFSRKLRSGEWDTCPHHLMTCDIGSRFEIRELAGAPLRFHCITAWEVLEHIPSATLPNLIENISRHLATDGIFVGSVDTAPDSNPVTGAVYHLTLQPKSWWLEQFGRAGLVEWRDHPFETTDYVRGHGMGLADWDPADGHGFHLVLRRSK
jgi:2-polyprenyl-3-methyl-5-hydroxy-6-metoxy-1,4-benzoquinol methylase